MQGTTLILGIGNILWADEGFGVRAVETLDRHYEFAGDVAVVDGGTQGIYLLEHVQNAETLVIFDAVDYGLPPATIRLIEGDAVPNYLGAKKVSLHQTGFQEVLATAEMLGHRITDILLVGVQPVQIEDFGGSLHPRVRDCITPAIDAALNWLAERGIEAKRRPAPLDAAQSIGSSEIDMDRYEQERPGEDDACRIGDERVLSSKNYDIAYRPAPLEPGSIDVDVDHRGQVLMCIGIPMMVVEVRGSFAICEGMGERREINTQLVGDQPVGTWLLTFLDAAREVVSAEDAALITDALIAVDRVMQGDTNVDHLFDDIIHAERVPPVSNNGPEDLPLAATRAAKP